MKLAVLFLVRRLMDRQHLHKLIGLVEEVEVLPSFTGVRHLYVRGKFMEEFPGQYGSHRLNVSIELLALLRKLESGTRL